ncbi:MAG TPA: hypothetical protein VFA35_10070 [Burkholderiaceae bacterium]|nr:hypothetical protein [Burkholderiaceae bacterium]
MPWLGGVTGVNVEFGGYLSLPDTFAFAGVFTVVVNVSSFAFGPTTIVTAVEPQRAGGPELSHTL